MADRPISMAAHVQHLEDPPGSGMMACTGGPLPRIPEGGRRVVCTGCTVLAERLRERRETARDRLDALEALIDQYLAAGARIRAQWMPGTPAGRAACELLARARPGRWELTADAYVIRRKGTDG